MPGARERPQRLVQVENLEHRMLPIVRLVLRVIIVSNVASATLTGSVFTRSSPEPQRRVAAAQKTADSILIATREFGRIAQIQLYTYGSNGACW